MFFNHFQIRIISYLLITIFMILIFILNLFPCFISGFLTYEFIILFSRFLEPLINKKISRYIIIFIIILIFLIIIILLIYKIFIYINLIKFIKIKNIDNFLSYIYEKIIYNIPNIYLKEVYILKKYFLFLIKKNIYNTKYFIQNFFHIIFNIFIGFIIGLIISTNINYNSNNYLKIQCLKRLNNLSIAFKNVIISQIKISIINTLLTSIIIIVFFPIFGINLIYKNFLILITFIFGLIPIIGNIISNIIIIFISLYTSVKVSFIMLIYLIFIHKLEYFLNVKIIGNKINSKSWELLLIMIIFKEIFGLSGLIAAPIYYSYVKTELKF
ncbi:hypothetical protein [Sodalis-like secondary symbiont of Drepanosiphum platanoidis]|uniref:hypothetical protein n=1 Tax=Sodalis-like secondary symbiont of Drepanosiphum platanoidis TaxID=2994493 RepID=UPI003463CC8B